jgi:Ca2+-binding RTX toxin-like protein
VSAGGAVRLLVLVLLAIAGSAAVARAGANVVGVSGADLQSQAITANGLKPPECDGVTVGSIVVATPGGSTNGGGSGSLILGSPLGDTIRAQNGTDCVLGGGGDDTLLGQGRDDVLIGGPGNDTLNGGAGVDICYGGPGLDSFTGCEIAIQ